jgi:hypothetical protein
MKDRGSTLRGLMFGGIVLSKVSPNDSSKTRSRFLCKLQVAGCKLRVASCELRLGFRV